MVIFIGIVGGVKDVGLGDIVVGICVYGYELGKVIVMGILSWFFVFYYSFVF